MSNGHKDPNLYKLPLALLMVAVMGVLIAVPFTSPMGGFWIDAQQLAVTGHIKSVFTPCGYPALVGLGYRIGGIAGVVATQLLVYVSIVVAVYCILRLLEVKRAQSLLGACLIGFHPDLLINIKKIWDTNITVALLMAILAALLVIMRNGLTPARAAVAGALWGLCITVRPNFPIIALPIAFALYKAPVDGNRLRALASNGALVLAAAAIVIVAVNTGAHGTFYFPQNGPYNLYAGDNFFTSRALVFNLNAEPSIYPSLLAAGFGPNVDVYNPGLRPYYVQHALLYIRQNPFPALGLAALKLGTLLRPDTKIHPLATPEGIAKAFLALAIPFWVTTLVISRRYRWAIEDWLFVVFVIAYIVPFVLTNSDPRFRIPLDVLVVTHSMYRVARVYPPWNRTPVPPA